MNAFITLLPCRTRVRWFSSAFIIREWDIFLSHPPLPPPLSPPTSNSSQNLDAVGHNPTFSENAIIFAIWSPSLIEVFLEGIAHWCILDVCIDVSWKVPLFYESKFLGYLVRDLFSRILDWRAASHNMVNKEFYMSHSMNFNSLIKMSQIKWGKKLWRYSNELWCSEIKNYRCRSVSRLLTF